METRKVKLQDIKPAPYNPRQELGLNDEEYKALRRSIEKFGVTAPIIWNERTGNIVGGHQRYNVLRKLREKETEVVVINVDEADEKLLNIALNKIEGEWDYDKLDEIIGSMTAEELQFTGFVKEEKEEPTTTEAKSKSEKSEPSEAQECTVYLSFETRGDAELWLEEEGITQSFPRGSRSVVVNVGGQNETIEN